MGRANVFSMAFEKRILVLKQQTDLMAALNANHGYINIQRNLSRVLGSLLAQVGDLDTSSIIQFVFNQIFT